MKDKYLYHGSIKKIKGEIIQPPFYNKLSTENIIKNILKKQEV